MFFRCLGIDKCRATSAAKFFATVVFARGATGMARICAFWELRRMERVKKRALTSHLQHTHNTLTLHSHYTHITLTSHSHHTHITLTSHLHYTHITFISHLHHTHITLTSFLHHAHITLKSHDMTLTSHLRVIGEVWFFVGARSVLAAFPSLPFRCLI